MTHNISLLLMVISPIIIHNFNGLDLNLMALGSVPFYSMPPILIQMS